MKPNLARATGAEQTKKGLYTGTGAEKDPKSEQYKAGAQGGMVLSDHGS